MDSFKNFAKVTVSTGYDASATSIALTAGHGARLPTPPFNATWWNSTDFADPSDDPNAEIIRVTALASDTGTITRAQEGTSASTKNTAGKVYKWIAGLTAKTLNEDVGGSSTVQQQVINGRLTLESGVPVSITDQTAKTTIYFTPFQGNCISLYESPDWMCHTFSQLSLALGTLVADTNYDVFAYNNAGTPALELSLGWASATARADALVLQDGIYVKSGTPTRRYLGTFRTTTTTTTEDSLLKRFVWNRANALGRDLYYSTETTHNYNGVARMWANNANARLQFVTGLAEELITTNVAAEMVQIAGVFTIAGIGLDALTPYRTLEAYVQVSAGTGSTKVSATEVLQPQIGYHVLNLIERTFSGAGDFNKGAVSAIVRG